MAKIWRRASVARGKLIFFAPTQEGLYPVSGRLECPGCDPEVAILFHHAGLSIDLPSTQIRAEQAVAVDQHYGQNSVGLGPSLAPEGSGWSEPPDFFGWCVALLDPQGKRYGYEFVADLKPEGCDQRIKVEFTDRNWRDSFFKAVTPGEDAMILVHFTGGDPPTGKRVQYKPRRAFDDALRLCEAFGEPFTEHD